MRLLELPVHWSLDDWPRFGWSIDLGGNVGAVYELYDSWLAEYESARDERRHVCFTMHPEVIGRAYRFAQLERLVDRIVADGDTWIAPLDDVAAHAAAVLAARCGPRCSTSSTLGPAPAGARGRQLGRGAGGRDPRDARPLRATSSRASPASPSTSTASAARRSAPSARGRPPGARDRGHRRRCRPAGRATSPRSTRARRCWRWRRRAAAASAASPSSSTPSPRGPVALQTWDWHEELASSFHVLCIEHPDGHVVRTLTEYGIVGKLGVSTPRPRAAAEHPAPRGRRRRASACRSTSWRDGCWTRRSTSTTPCSCWRRRRRRRARR